MNLIRLACVVLALLCIGTAAATTKTVDLWLKADVVIQTDGTVTELVWREQTKLHALVAARLEPRVRTWEFVPATLDGQSADTRTGLSLRVQATEQRGGVIELRLKEARTGPITDALIPPRYPTIAINNGVQGIVVVEILVDPEGKADVIGMEFEGSAGQRYRKDFLAATEHAVKAWQFKPEVVAGQPRPTRMRMPIDFCIDGTGWCEQQSVRLQLSGLPRELPVALDSAVALKTDVRDMGM